jgi:hypothetical protein
MEICRWSRSLQHGHPVFEQRSPCKRPVPVFLHKLVRVQILTRRLTPSNKEQMIHAETEWVCPTKKTVYGHGERNAPCIDGFAKRGTVPRPPNQYMRQASPEEKKPKKSRCTDEDEKVAVVATTNAVVEPHAVVVLRLDTVVADATVVGARWAPDVAALAVLGWHLHCGVGARCRHHHSPLGRCRAKTQWVIIRIRRRERVQIAGKDLTRSVKSSIAGSAQLTPGSEADA